MSVEVAAVGVKLGIEVLKRTAPKGISWLVTYTTGVELLIVGPGGSGKTSFSNYLANGVLYPKGSEHFKTPDVETSSTFAVSMGRDQSLSLKVRRTTDVPGQIGATHHANIVRDRKPHAVVILFDAADDLETLLQWLNDFCERMETIFNDLPSLKRKLRSITVLLNQRDKVDEAKVDALRKAMRETLKRVLGPTLGQERAKNVAILPSVLVQTPEYDTSLVDSAIVHIALQLKK